MAVGNHPSENSKNDKIAETKNICLGINITFQLQKYASLQLQDPVRHAASQQRSSAIRTNFSLLFRDVSPKPALTGRARCWAINQFITAGGQEEGAGHFGEPTRLMMID